MSNLDTTLGSITVVLVLARAFNLAANRERVSLVHKNVKFFHFFIELLWKQVDSVLVRQKPARIRRDQREDGTIRLRLDDVDFNAV